MEKKNNQMPSALVTYYSAFILLFCDMNHLVQALMSRSTKIFMLI